jgi:hypothetical protein
MYPCKEELLRKYPELKCLWIHYIELCKQPATLKEVSRAFEDYRGKYIAARDRYSIVPTPEIEAVI